MIRVAQWFARQSLGIGSVIGFMISAPVLAQLPPNPQPHPIPVSDNYAGCVNTSDLGFYQQDISSRLWGVVSGTNLGITLDEFNEAESAWTVNCRRDDASIAGTGSFVELFREELEFLSPSPEDLSTSLLSRFDTSVVAGICTTTLTEVNVYGLLTEIEFAAPDATPVHLRWFTPIADRPTVESLVSCAEAYASLFEPRLLAWQDSSGCAEGYRLCIRAALERHLGRIEECGGSAAVHTGETAIAALGCCWAAGPLCGPATLACVIIGGGLTLYSFHSCMNSSGHQYNADRLDCQAAYLSCIAGAG